MFISHPLIKQFKVEARDYQIEIAEKCLKANTLVVLPTGLGKTNIALLVCAEKLNKEEGRILFLAPTKPLIEQHKKTFENFSEIKDLVAVSGSVKPEKRKNLYEKARIVFATPQTIANDLKNGILRLDDFILLIVDEAHHSVGNYSYTYIAERYAREAKKPLILGLTASPGGRIEKIEEIKRNLFIDKVEARSEFDEKIRRFVDSKPQVMKPLMINTFMPIASFKNYMIAILKYSFQAVKKVRKLRRYFPATFYYGASDSFTGEHVIYLEITFPELGIKYKEELYKVIAKTFKDDLIRLGRAFYSGFVPFFTLKRFYDLSVKKFFFSRALFSEFFLHVKDVFGKELPRISEKPLDIAPIITSPRNTVESLVNKLTFNQSKDISKIHLDA